MHKKRGVFFTIDAILAAGIFFILIILISTVYVSEPSREQTSYYSQDSVRVFTNLKVNEVDNDYISDMITQGIITKENNTILEQIGEFWAEDDLELARNFTKNITNSLVPMRYGIGIYVDGDEIYSRNASSSTGLVSRTLISSRKIISGIAKQKPKEGFTSKVVLAGIKSKTTNAYSFFEGYEGDGNLTKKLILPGNVISIDNVTLEVDTEGNFDMYVNDAYSGSYTGGAINDMAAEKYAIAESYYSSFINDTNIFTINFTSGNPFVAGGFLKVKYTTSSVNDTVADDSKKYWLPGIYGFINYFGSIFSGGNLENMEIFLDFWSNYTTVLEIANTTVYQNNPDGPATVTLDNASLAAIFAADGRSYSDLSRKTLPVRFAVVNASVGNADVVLATDVSGSMDFCSTGTGWSPGSWTLSNTIGCFYWSGNWYYAPYSPSSGSGSANYERTIWTNNSQNYCGCRMNPSCGADQTRIEVYKEASEPFVDILLNVSGNKMGIVDYTGSDADAGLPVYENTCSTSSPTASFFSDGIARTVSLSQNSQQIKNDITATETWWGTCTCCGVNKAVDMLNSQSSAERNKTIVVMSDGQANIECPDQGTGSATNDAIQAAQDACSQGIPVYTIGFGADVDETTLQSMACGGGFYTDATNPSQLQQAYNTIANNILELTYETQQPAVTFDSYVNPTSYIQLNYSEVSDLVFGKIPLTFETDTFGNAVTSGTLTIPTGTTPFEARVISYSGDKWTDNLVVNSNQIYLLSDYGDSYALLGDPFNVQIPVANLNEGSNSITISTGTGPSNNSGGSVDNKAIYTLLLDSSIDFSSVVSKSVGCSWYVDYEDGNSATVKIPKTYTGSDVCNFTSDTYDSDDSINLAVYSMLTKLDLDNDKQLEVKLDEDSLNLESLTITNVPSLWGPSIVEIRVWE